MEDLASSAHPSLAALPYQSVGVLTAFRLQVAQAAVEEVQADLIVAWMNQGGPSTPLEPLLSPHLSPHLFPILDPYPEIPSSSMGETSFLHDQTLPSSKVHP